MKYFGVVWAFLFLLSFSRSAGAAVEVYQVSADGSCLPVISYTLNCTADVTIEIEPESTPGSPIRTVNLPNQAKGERIWYWDGLKDDGTPAPADTYIARITATSNQAQWDPIVGLFLNNDYDTEYPPRPLPTVPDLEGYYGIGINKDPASEYYGRIYTCHKGNKDVLIYDCDGTYLGAMNDAGIEWGASGPWDLAVADDGYVYVADRTYTCVYCFDPEGAYVSSSPPLSWINAMFARTDGAGVTHIYYSAANGVYETIVQADHVTWGGFGWPKLIYNPGTGARGMWVSSDLSTAYQACDSGTNVGVTRWLKQPNGTYLQDAGFPNTIGAAIDVDMNFDNAFLWVTKMVAYSPSPLTTAIRKISVPDGAVTDPGYDVVSWGLMCAADNVGNVAVTFGKSTPTWAQRYWGLFAEPGTTTAQRQTVPVYYSGGPCDLPPTPVPGSYVWTYTCLEDGGKLMPDSADTARLEFRVVDADGWQDIGTVTVDLWRLGGLPVRPMDSVIPDPGDPQGLTVICRVTMTAVNGTQAGSIPLTITANDVHPAEGFGTGTTDVIIGGRPLDGTVLYNRSGMPVQGAEIVAVGGLLGAPGYPFIYRSPLTNSGGYASMNVSEGSYQVYAEKLGYKTQTPANANISTPTCLPSGSVSMGNLYLGPLTIAEARTLPNGTNVNIEAVCYAWPEDLPQAYGLADRTESSQSYHQWYLCDRDNASSGILCFAYSSVEWDPAEPGYIGPRPTLGDTICMEGTIAYLAGCERRILQGLAGYYQNRGNLGGLPGPVAVTIPDILSPSNWGKFGRIQNAMVVAGGSSNYVWIGDLAGNRASITADTPTSLGLTSWPPNVGTAYNFTGALGRRAYLSEGTIRVRQQSDIVPVSSLPDPGPNTVAQVRGVATGQTVNVRGIVTLKGSGYLYLESSDRSSGVRVQTAPGYVSTGDDVQAVGNLVISDGEKAIEPAYPLLVRGSGNPIPPALNLRTRDIGGSDYGPNDPGVTDGRGALNVGLLVSLSGMVTARDPGGQWLYLWDGANRVDSPLDDGSGNKGVRVASTFACTPWTDWVEVTGVVSTNATAVSGRVIPEILPTAGPIRITSFDTITEAAGEALDAQWNLIGLPAAPANTGAGEASTKPWVPWMVLGPNRIPDDLDARLYRFENANQSMYLFDMWTEPDGPFGGLLLGDGYWLCLNSAWPVAYSANASSLDEWISVEEPGWLLFGHPKGDYIYWADYKVHDGAQVKTLYEASQFGANWISSVLYWFDSDTQSMVDVGIPDDFPTGETMLPWHGYWCRVFEPGKALICPDQPVAPPP